jgi:fibronectin type 3 domain-containing protein
VYRRTRRATPYTRINRDLVPDTNYVDDSVHAGEIYYYETTAVSSGGIESGRSKRIRIRVPYP